MVKGFLMGNENNRLGGLTGIIAFAIAFVIGCMFLYWAVEYWVYNSFDGNRYELSKIQVKNSDSLSTWILDKRTGNLVYCTKSYDKMDHFVCVRSVTIDGKEYNAATDDVKQEGLAAPQSPISNSLNETPISNSIEQSPISNTVAATEPSAVTKPETPVKGHKRK